MLRLGAQHVTAIDYDEKSVEATKSQLGQEENVNYVVQQADILQMESIPRGEYDIVYSWGVLHHTGNLSQAIANAASLVRHGGLLVVALYRKTPMCPFWALEKLVYSKSPHILQLIFQYVFMAAFALELRRVSKTSLKEYIKNYDLVRGMSYRTDLHDWLGGFPYESIAAEVYEKSIEHDFDLVRRFVSPPSDGRFGTGCDEFVHRRIKRMT
jgi:2-polyprenyl-6-hydroxyphenyl methylase/3-demethylubiquinone-9 3-methyltransferase